MSSKIVLVGKAASGKDFFRKRMMDKGFTFGVSCTTRLKRIKDNEVDGKDYHFKSDAEFDTKLEELGFTGNSAKPKITKKKEAKSSDIAAQLSSLKKLLDDGILTQDEFDKAKKKLLN